MLHKYVEIVIQDVVYQESGSKNVSLILAIIFFLKVRYKMKVAGLELSKFTINNKTYQTIYCQ